MKETAIPQEATGFAAPGPTSKPSPRAPVRPTTKGIAGTIGTAIGLTLILCVAVLGPSPGYTQPAVQIANHFLNDTATWNASDATSLSAGTYLTMSRVTEIRTGFISSLTLKAFLGATLTPAGVSVTILLDILGNISPDLRPSSITTVESDYPGNYTDPLLQASFTSNLTSFAPSVNISYPKPFGYAGNTGFVGQGALVDTVGLLGVNGHSRFFFADPASAYLVLAFPANYSTVYSSFHISAELNGVSPGVACGVSLDITDNFSSSAWS